jgi:diaminohydroxyphosphoribosylaminopyrimidine deaminase/5-amino-6-(5-phosphoribosylamino)uracil reductase
MGADHEALMRLAIDEAELARGTTGDNPWVGCVIVNPQGQILARGHTQGPGEDHAEIAAARYAKARGLAIEGATMYSTLEPCSFHGRTPACSHVIVEHRLAKVVFGMRDPHPRVDGAGAQILKDAGIEVIEGVCERDVRRQLGSWVFTYHPHEPLRRARELALTLARDDLLAALADIYGVDFARVESVVAAVQNTKPSADR